MTSFFAVRWNGDLSSLEKPTSLMDISKIFSPLQPREDEEEDTGCSQAVFRDDEGLLTDLLSQDRYRRCVNLRSGWASQGHLRFLELLLAHGAEVDSLDAKAQTPLFTAVTGRHLDCLY
ncbi:ankyrin repeat and SOCS box protein 12-like [Carassius gibelio]|uniref:ankyrin repeat and SOCS box protein 12-like n=1 Tax=Carassius gibelio TaxID=101364 RepID=UPI002278B263|nr:ankyrin repeat and SOCS box protein 12-like [Carassius gibelio]